jgi:hypothetical protein
LYSSTSTFGIATIRVVNSTTIRIMTTTTSLSLLVGRWTLVEYN